MHEKLVIKKKICVLVPLKRIVIALVLLEVIVVVFLEKEICYIHKNNN